MKTLPASHAPFPAAEAILVIEDDPGDFRLVEVYARQAGICRNPLARARTLQEGIAAARRERPDVILLDLDLPDSRPGDTLETAIVQLSDCPVVVMTGHDDLQLANAALEMGAQDYLVKGQFDAQALGRAIRHALVRARLETRLRQSEQRLDLALAGSGLGLWDWLLTTGEAYFNDGTRSMLGYGSDADWRRIEDWESLIHPDDLARHQAALNTHLIGDSPDYYAEYRLRHRNGHWVWVVSRGRVVMHDATGKPARAAGTVLDITQQKRLTLEGTELLHRIEALIRAAGDPPGTRSATGPAAPAAPAAPASPLKRLSARQREVLHLVAQGHTSLEIARRLGISHATAVTHRRDLMRKLDLHTVADLTRFALRHDNLER